MKLFVGYSKASEQPQSCTWPKCQPHTITSMGRKPATILIAAYNTGAHRATKLNSAVHDLKVMSSNPIWVERRVHSTLLLLKLYLNQKQKRIGPPRHCQSACIQFTKSTANRDNNPV